MLNAVLRLPGYHIRLLVEQQIDRGGGLILIPDRTSIKRSLKYFQEGDVLYIAEGTRRTEKNCPIVAAVVCVSKNYTQYYQDRFWRRRIIAIQWRGFRWAEPGERDPSALSCTLPLMYTSVISSAEQERRDRRIYEEYVEEILQEREAIGYGSSSRPQG